MNQEEYNDAVKEVKTEIIMRQNMIKKSEGDTKKISYWENRIKKMEQVLRVLNELHELSISFRNETRIEEIK